MANTLAPQDAYVRCACGTMILRGETPEGLRIDLDPAQHTYVALWEPEATKHGKAPHYRLVRSMGYPVHICQAGKE